MASNGGVILILLLVLVGGFMYTQGFDFQSFLDKIINTSNFTSSNSTIQECIKNSDCESKYKSCFNVCSTGKCYSTGELPNLPCSAAVWKGYPICAYDTSGCIITTPINYSCSTSDTTWKCGPLSGCVGLFKIKNCCEYTNTFDGPQIINMPEKFYCDESKQFKNSGFKGSTYGTINIYLASSIGTKMDSYNLNNFATSFKKYLYEASYGMIDNVNFIQAPLINLSITPSIQPRLGNDIKASYIFSASYPMGGWLYSPNSNINWGFSSAVYHAKFPWGWTTLMGGDISADGCTESVGSSSHTLCRESAHELAHAIFACEDYEGNLMRPMPDLTDINHFPPICLEKIKYYMPKLVG